MRKPKYDDKIIKLLKKHGVPMTVLAIAKQLGDVRPTTIYKVLDRLTARNQLVKIGATYTLMDAPVEYTVVVGGGSESLTEPKATNVKNIPKISSVDAWRVVAKELSGEISSIEVSINDLTIQKQSLQQIHNRLSSIFGNAS